MNQPRIVPFLRRLSPTAGPGGLPVLEPYDEDRHRVLVGKGHTIEHVAMLEVDAPVTYRREPGEAITATIAAELDLINGVYTIAPAGEAGTMGVDAWKVRPA